MGDPYLGQIKRFGFNFAPTGWALCQGQILPISQNTALFSLLGTMYGGDGKTNFALPDLRGRVPIGWGQGPGLSDYSVGELAGSEAVTLDATQMPSHTHVLDTSGLTATRQCLSTPGTKGSPSNNLPASEAGGLMTSYSSAAPDASMNASAIAFTGNLTAATTGGGIPHQNMQPYLTLNFCIAVAGIFPPRS